MKTNFPWAANFLLASSAPKRNTETPILNIGRLGVGLADLGVGLADLGVGLADLGVGLAGLDIGFTDLGIALFDLQHPRRNQLLNLGRHTRVMHVWLCGAGVRLQLVEDFGHDGVSQDAPDLFICHRALDLLGCNHPAKPQ